MSGRGKYLGVDDALDHDDVEEVGELNTVTALRDQLQDITPTTYGNSFVLSPPTMDAIQAEATRAHLKHGDHSMLDVRYTAHERLAILLGEVGDVARELTYGQRNSRNKLARELIQVAAMAATWAEYLEGTCECHDEGCDHDHGV
jgi:hypothetical protein